MKRNIQFELLLPVIYNSIKIISLVKRFSGIKDTFEMYKINFINILLTITLITESSRHSFCRWQIFLEALIDSKMIQTYPKTHLINDF